jgi:hypothetical protein
MLVPLASLPWIGETEMLGLANGSLYEVLDVDSGQGLTKVNAKGSISPADISPVSIPEWGTPQMSIELRPPAGK